MKKIMAILLVLALASMMGIYAFAGSEPGLGLGDVDPIDVTATYQAGSAAGLVYSVDVSWGSLVFKYSATQKTWDPINHVEVDGPGSWAPDVAGTSNKITVTNHSNAPIEAAFDYDDDTAGKTEGAFSDSGLLELGAATAGVAGATEGNILLTIATAAGKTIDSGIAGTIGTVTITLSTPD